MSSSTLLIALLRIWWTIGIFAYSGDAFRITPKALFAGHGPGLVGVKSARRSEGLFSPYLGVPVHSHPSGLVMRRMAEEVNSAGVQPSPPPATESPSPEAQLSHTVSPTETTLESASAATTTKVDEVEGSRGIVLVMLLAVPLFCKFIMVLMIKILTDLVVLPLLLLVRLIRLTPRRVRQWWSGKNSATKTSSSSTVTNPLVLETPNGTSSSSGNSNNNPVSP